MQEYLAIKSEFATNRYGKSQRDSIVMKSKLGHLMNKIVDIDAVCVDILNNTQDADASAIRSRLEIVYSDLENMFDGI
jgi:hypothetical protein